MGVDEIDWIDVDGDYARLHVGKLTHLLRETLGDLERRLPARFLRIHRSIIVQADRIQSVQPWFKGDYVITLRDGTRLDVGPHLPAAGAGSAALTLVRPAKKLRPPSFRELPGARVADGFHPAGPRHAPWDVGGWELTGRAHRSRRPVRRAVAVVDRIAVGG